MRFSLKLSLVLVFIMTAITFIQDKRVASVPTIGDKIIDLVCAKQSGVITEEEFRQLKRKALASF